MAKTKIKVAFVHPDLGLGGAERLIVDSAVGLKELGHEASIYTAHYDENRRFPEVSSINVHVVGGFIPRTLAGKFKVRNASEGSLPQSTPSTKQSLLIEVCFFPVILLNTLKQALLTSIQCMYIAIYLCFLCPYSFDVAVCDIVSLPNVIFWLFRKPVVFYCHFPDKLLVRTLQADAQGHGRTSPSPVLQLYRFAVDFLEEYSMRFASVILVNSSFTASMFKEAFKSLRSVPMVVHPSVQIAEEDSVYADDLQPDELIVLSLNRYERKKSVEIAIEALAKVKDLIPNTTFANVKLVIAGGWDARLAENREYELELQEMANRLSVRSKVIFKRNVSDSERRDLMRKCTCLLYTPPEEHFGIVPLEAMAASRAVIACSSGGPLETIEEGVSGFLCEASGEAFANQLRILLLDQRRARQMGENGLKRVEALFSRKAFSEKFEAALMRALAMSHRDFREAVASSSPGSDSKHKIT
ncbi:hypothetical protein NDN08_000469 [Rhodosorus marinus]|uniref:Alpha-1,3/1,6-mannosyltransferase ALG2 n=1 Tax=Rhodosorus marinus TaxID=101924 RepID=A0AAV8US96_9RHOD|nr:hypothetical protein NDN08_000469 [Rhodosorus marinus]